jgi:hypothetical protein
VLRCSRPHLERGRVALGQHAPIAGRSGHSDDASRDEALRVPHLHVVAERRASARAQFYECSVASGLGRMREGQWDIFCSQVCRLAGIALACAHWSSVIGNCWHTRCC